jgi:hypothetical protein
VPDINTFCVNEGDHYIIDGSIPLLNFKWYNETLSNMPGFNGFASRTIYPDSKFRYESKEVTNILLIIDSSWEQQIGLAPQFNPYLLGRSQVMLG